MSENMFADPNPRAASTWPHDQSYINLCNCDSLFLGPKRAPSCWACAPESTKEWWLAKFTETKP